MQRLRRLLARPSVRRADGAFVVEGATVAAVAIGAGAEVEAVYLAPSAGPAEEAVAEAAVAAGARRFELAPGVIDKVADTVTPQPLLAVVRQPPPRPELVAASSFTVVLAGVRDPGNAGTVVRSAAAAGAQLVVATLGTVDLFNPKTVRASAGAVLQVPLVTGVEPSSLLGDLGAAGVRRIGAVVAGGQVHHTLSWLAPVAIVLGNERSGVDPLVAEHLDGLVTIPMPGPVESLNVSMAATVLCFEVARQRSNLQAVHDHSDRGDPPAPRPGQRS